jgi:hypothetical protein
MKQIRRSGSLGVALAMLVGGLAVAASAPSSARAVHYSSTVTDKSGDWTGHNAGKRFPKAAKRTIDIKRVHYVFGNNHDRLITRAMVAGNPYGAAGFKSSLTTTYSWGRAKSATVTYLVVHRKDGSSTISAIPSGDFVVAPPTPLSSCVHPDVLADGRIEYDLLLRCIDTDVSPSHFRVRTTSQVTRIGGAHANRATDGSRATTVDVLAPSLDPVTHKTTVRDFTGDTVRASLGKDSRPQARRNGADVTGATFQPFTHQTRVRFSTLGHYGAKAFPRLELLLTSEFAYSGGTIQVQIAFCPKTDHAVGDCSACHETSPLRPDGPSPGRQPDHRAADDDRLRQHLPRQRAHAPVAE